MVYDILYTNYRKYSVIFKYKLNMSGKKDGEMFTYRQLKQSDLKIACGWMIAEQWPISEHMLQCFYDSCPSGGIVVENDKGEIVGGVFTDSNKEDAPVAWIIVQSEWRKHGLGSALLKKALTPMKDKNVFLCGVQSSVDYYISQGIDIADLKLALFSGTLKKENLQPSETSQYSIQPCGTEKLDDLDDYDKGIFPISRKSFLKQWMDPKVTTTFIATSNDAKTVGYGCVQKLTEDNFLIGPLFANTSAIAKDLLSKMSDQVTTGKKIFHIYIPLCNSWMVKLVEDLELKNAFEADRLYSKRKIGIDVSRVYGMTDSAVSVI